MRSASRTEKVGVMLVESREDGPLDLLERLLAAPDTMPEPVYPGRDAGHAATEDEDPFGAVLRFCAVPGASAGPLTGWRLGVKDTIPVAGIPTMDGLPAAAPVVPVQDAIAVARCLAAGAMVSATTTVSFPPVLTGARVVRNPWDPRCSPGGSSSGSAVAVASGMVDAALGVDGAGSVRIPAAWCGLVGVKPTARLVPIRGCVDYETNEIGPITRDVEQSALLLEVLAGSASGAPGERVGHHRPYSEAADLGIEGLRVGIVQESMSRCGPATLEAFSRACRPLRELGAAPEAVSVPLWPLGTALGTMVRTLARLSDAAALGLRTTDWADPGLLRTRRAHYRSDGFLQRQAAFIEAAQKRDDAPLARVAGLRAELTAQVEGALSRFDLLITPTTPTGPYPLEIGPIPRAAGTPEPIELATANCDPFNVTGHPALTVPAGHGEHDLPAGLQIAGRRCDEFTLYRAAFALERALLSRPREVAQYHDTILGESETDDVVG